MIVYTAVRWTNDGAPEVCLFESQSAAADWLFEFNGAEEADCWPLREALYFGKEIELVEGVYGMILNLTVRTS